MASSRISRAFSARPVSCQRRAYHPMPNAVRRLFMNRLYQTWEWIPPKNAFARRALSRRLIVGVRTWLQMTSGRVSSGRGAEPASSPGRTIRAHVPPARVPPIENSLQRPYRSRVLVNPSRAHSSNGSTWGARPVVKNGSAQRFQMKRTTSR